MRSKTVKAIKKKSSSKRKDNYAQSHEYETMSQAQNRYGSGREHSGSDGSNNSNSNYSNH